MKVYRWFCIIIVVFISLIGLLVVPQLGYATQQAHASSATTTLSKKTSAKLVSKNAALPYGRSAAPMNSDRGRWRAAVS